MHPKNNMKYPIQQDQKAQLLKTKENLIPVISHEKIVENHYRTLIWNPRPNIKN